MGYRVSRLLWLSIGAAFCLQACGLGGHGMVPLQGLSANAASSISSGRHLTTRASVLGRSPDNAYQIRTFHDGRITIRDSSSYATPNGTFTQVDYATPFGYLTLVQSPKRPAPTSLPSPSSTLLVIANGTTSQGATWFVLADPKPDYIDVHMEVGDSSVDTTLPGSVPLASIKAAVEEVY
jgi:hypothetical protein